ncbi:hypothetical protein AMS68_000195 [Peltaster fructicola]|uniref:Uncharacterized protein n=1 Tax=Peltaster fructicola TaxID=286661 RepID=A0A6H0XJ60_9PEZI|nr:hypothetical protein AMS68_000195 [Peltaster fructicola]
MIIIRHAHACHSISSDSSFTYLHMHASQHADLLEEFSKPRLPAEDIIVQDRYKPANPDEEEDIVPDQRAAFGIQRANNKAKEPAWKDLGLEQLMTQGPPTNKKPTAHKGTLIR